MRVGEHLTIAAHGPMVRPALEAAVAAEQLSRLIGDALGHALTPEETAYLALHTSRLYADLHELPGPGRPE